MGIQSYCENLLLSGHELTKGKICNFIPRDDVNAGDWNQKTGLEPLIFKGQEPKIILGLSDGGADKVNIVSPSFQDEDLSVLKGGGTSDTSSLKEAQCLL